MHLVTSLASGVNGAANGFATFYQRGTATVATYYADFEASQAAPASALPLDGFGSLVAYVNQLVDVQVVDSSGVLVREFVAGAEAPAVEVISQSFTGTSYSDGSSGTSKPTNLQVVLDGWLTSAGQPDFNVTVAGVKTKLSAAVAGLAGLFFNVRSYGAVGDGVADDGASIQAAVAAAVASPGAGGIVFFPPGIYRSTSVVTMSAGVSLMGCGGTSSKLAFDSAVIAQGILVANSSGVVFISGLWVSTINTNFTAALLKPASSGLSIVDCLFGGDATTKGILIADAGAIGGFSNCVVERCALQNNADIQLITQTGTGRLTIRNCSANVFAGNYTHAVFDLLGDFLVDNCRFDGTLMTGGTPIYIQLAPTATSASGVIANCRFSGCGAVTPTAIKNTLAAPGRDCMEYGNTFGDSNGGVTAYAYTTDGFTSLGNLSDTARSHGSRIGRCAEYLGNGATQALDPKTYGVITVLRSGGAGQTLTATKGSLGDQFTLQLLNETVGALTFTFAAPDFSFVAGAVTIAVNAGTRAYLIFGWSAINPSGTAGQWALLTAANNNVP